MKKQCERAKIVFSPAQGRKWAGLADVLWYSQFWQWKVDENFWGLYYIALGYIKAMLCISGPPGGSGQTPEYAYLGHLRGSTWNPLKDPRRPLTISKGFGIMPLKHIIDRS